MSIAELSFTNATARQTMRSPEDYQSGQTVDAALEKPDAPVVSWNLDEAQNGYLAHDAMLLTTITSLPDSSVRVVRPLRALVQPTSGVYMATLVDTAISASGESSAEAVECLKDILAAKFRLYSRKESVLGKQLLGQLHVLRRFLRAT